MNVLMLAPDFLPAWGGVGVYISEIANNLPNDVEVHILTPLRSQFKQNQIKENDRINNQFHSNVHIHNIGVAKENFLYNLSFQLNCLRYVPQFIKEYEIDIIHSQSAMPDLFLSPKKVKSPIITTIHTTIEGQLMAVRNTKSSFHELDSSEKMILALGPFLKYIENSYYRKDRYYITTSQWGKNVISAEKKIDPEKMNVIYNGVDNALFTPENKKNTNDYFPELDNIDSLKILYLSRLVKYKGINNLIDAIPKILKSIDAHFIIAGAGRQILIDEHFKKNYSFLGYVNHERTPFLYSMSDIFILPSLYENFPLSILESMASQNAVIATNVSGVPEMIQTNQNGLLIPPNDTDSIARAIISLGEDTTLRQRLSRNARTTVIEKFNWKTAALKTKDFYEKVLQK
jgi:glycosyltransferase involved in cell wall biosynthesis